MTPVSQPLYEIAGLRRTYEVGATPVQALDGIDLCLFPGELVAIEGTSGSGKSTMLAILGGLDRPTSGTVRFEGTDMGQLGDRELTALRAHEIGFVFQGFNLIPTLNAMQNVMAVMGSLSLSPSAQRARALELLDRVGLAARAHHLPSLMSGGEQQRVAIARALANQPRVVLADEPTGNLDSATAEGVMKLLRELGDDLGVTVVLVTHDPAVAMQAPRRVRMKDGRVLSDNGDRPFTSTVPDNVIVLPDARRRSGRGVALVGQAAALVALAGVGAVTLMPHSSPTSAPCVASCPQAAPVRVLKPLVAAPRTAAVVHVAPSPAASAPVKAPSIERASYRGPVPTATPSPSALPVKLPTVTLPKPVITPPDPVDVPVPEVPVETPSPAPVASWNPVFGWTGNTTMMDLIMASMKNGGRG
ncbi:MAG: ABC-type antimicrobial peptide transport system, ATPase component [Frankiales bacterium]|nr:ABC-type antimicrobial peptide transport system, ATPase component [Frankiales bacterium]